MATHSSVLAWRIPGMGEPGGLPSVAQSQTQLKRLSTWPLSNSGLLQVRAGGAVFPALSLEYPAVEQSCL